VETISIPIASIEISPDRQRKDMGNIPELADSILQRGQLVPIIVTQTETGYKLIAGERRVRAFGTLNLPTITAVLLSSLPTHEQELIELDENIKRKQLEWPEYVKAVARYTVLAKGQTQEHIANTLNMPPETISRIARLAPELEANPKLKLASSWTSAYSAVVAQEQKAAASVLEDILADTIAEPAPAPTEAAPVSQQYIWQADFREWLSTYSGKRFNLIHCDFPYGLNMDSANLQGSAVRWDATDGRYDDSPELFDALVHAFFAEQDRFIAESAHCIFWLAHKHYGRIWSRFRHFGWTPCEVPLIWHKSDNAGIAPDVRRQPRRTYEIAIFASRGDRKIVKVKAASFAAPTTKVHHLSEKPMSVVSHFLEMITDGTSEIFDPTCGSGTALEAAARLGASRVVGLDVLPQHVEYAQQRVAAAAASATSPGGDILDLG
jgi:ParB/RepB/Spo0J family partition protein